MTCLASGLGILISIFIPGDLIFAYLRNKRNKRLLKETMEKGTQPDLEISEDELILRPEIIKRLKKILQPYERQSFYHLVCGEHGTGKTTLIRLSSREIGHGVIYVDVPANPNLIKFGDAFGKALNFTFEEHISYTNQLIRKMFSKTEDTLSKWERALDAFKREAEVYKAKNGRPPVIVYDNVSRLVANHPRILDVLQDDAKDNADDKKYVAVFVCSEGSVPRRMESRSAWSRAKPAVEIGDFNEEETMEYLTKKRNIKEEDAKNIYELVGGRIIELNSVADDFLAGQPFADIKKSILNKVQKKFQSAKLLPNDPHYKLGKSIISDLLKSKELSYLAFKKYFDKVEALNEVLEGNVFAYHQENNVVTFQSKSVEFYIRENIDIFVNLIDLTPQEGTSSNQTNK